MSVRTQMYDVEVYIPHRLIKSLDKEDFKKLTESSYITVLTLMGFDRFDSSGIKTWDDATRDQVVFRFKTTNVIKPQLFGIDLTYRAKETK